MNRANCSRLLAVTLVSLCMELAAPGAEMAAGDSSEICRPILGPSPAIELGRAGEFTWSCEGGKSLGKGYYIVFIRPSGTYVLLKVPIGRSSFEFTPDTAGSWRWIVINTDPDRTKPDLESEAGYFNVTGTQDSSD